MSLWDGEDDLVLVGYSGAHVWAAHWAADHGVRAESIVYRVTTAGPRTCSWPASGSNRRG